MKTRPGGASKKRILVISDKGLAVSPARDMVRTLVPTRVMTVVRLLLTFGALLAAVADTGARTTPWAVIKCKFSDQPQEPVFEAELITAADGMAGYWRDVSYGQLSLDGSAIYGWYTLPFTLAQSQSMTRAQRIDACIAAATNVDFSQYYSVIAILNAEIDSGGQDGRVVLDPLAWAVTFAAHELGHSYGGPNHSWSANPDTEYGNPWDIMSAMDVHVFQGRFGTPDGIKHAAGPGLNAPNLDKLGWLVANRVWTWDGGTSQTVTLAALNHPEASGYLMAKLPFDAANANHYYTVEFRRKTGWDAGIPRDTVLINEVRTDGLFYLIGDGGDPERLPDQTFRDVTNNVAITVLNLDTNSSTATFNIGKNEVWVDFGYQGATELGTFDFPYDTLAEGLNPVAYNGTLKIKTGSRNETATISRKMRIEAYGGPVTIGQ